MKKGKDGIANEKWHTKEGKGIKRWEREGNKGRRDWRAIIYESG